MNAVLRHLRQARDIVATTHTGPDGDALGATLALAALLRAQERTVQVAIERAEVGAAAVLLADGALPLTPPAAANTAAELLVALDCGSLDRLPAPLQPLAGRIPVVNIDHHRTNTFFGTVNWVDPAAAGSGEMVWRLARRAGWPLDRAVAERLWVAVVTDTGRFAHENTSPATLRCAADLLRHGVRTAWLNDEIYGQFELKVLRLRGRACDSLETWCDGRVAVVSLTAADFAATGCLPADAEDIIEIPRAVRGSQVALFFQETPGRPGVTRLSIRTRPPLDAAALAQRFGGGGHPRAAGCTLKGALPRRRQALRAVVEQWLRSP